MNKPYRESENKTKQLKSNNLNLLLHQNHQKIPKANSILNFTNKKNIKFQPHISKFTLIKVKYRYFCTINSQVQSTGVKKKERDVIKEKVIINEAKIRIIKTESK